MGKKSFSEQSHQIKRDVSEFSIEITETDQSSLLLDGIHVQFQVSNVVDKQNDVSNVDKMCRKSNSSSCAFLKIYLKS